MATPEHYNKSIQPWDAMEAWMTKDQFQGFLQGNVIKYITRADHKGNTLQDLKKAQWYLNREVQTMEKAK
jgi:hypothetical protein